MTGLNHHLISMALLNCAPIVCAQRLASTFPQSPTKTQAISLLSPAAKETGIHLFSRVSTRVTWQFVHQGEVPFLPPHLPSLIHGVPPDSDAEKYISRSHHHSRES